MANPFDFTQSSVLSPFFRQASAHPDFGLNPAGDNLLTPFFSGHINRGLLGYSGYWVAWVTWVIGLLNPTNTSNSMNPNNTLRNPTNLPRKNAQIMPTEQSYLNLLQLNTFTYGETFSKTFKEPKFCHQTGTMKRWKIGVME